MKPTLTTLICSFFVAIQPAYSQAYIVTNGVTFLGNNGFGYETHVLQNSTTLDYSGFLLIPKGKTAPTSDYINSFAYSTFTDEGVRAFVVSPNDPISLQAIQSQNYTELSSLSPVGYVYNVATPFFLGFYTGYGPTDNVIYLNPVFGWGEFVNLDGTIILLDSGLEYGGDGIYAGTLDIIQPVPEPATWALTVLGGLLLAWRCKRSH